MVVTLYALCELRTLLRASGVNPAAPFPVDLSEHEDSARDAIAASTIDVWLSEVLSQWWQLPEPVKLRLSHLLEMEAPPQVMQSVCVMNCRPYFVKTTVEAAAKTPAAATQLTRASLPSLRLPFPQADGRMGQMSMGRASDDSSRDRERAARAFSVDIDGDGDDSPVDKHRQMAQGLLAHEHVPGV